MNKPDIFTYHSARDFLKAWTEHLRSTRSGFSLRWLARKSNLSPGYLPLFFSGKRRLSKKGFSKIAPHLGLNERERGYLGLLRDLDSAPSPQRVHILKRLQRYRDYGEQNPREVEAYRYLTHWYYVAIRELASLPDFQGKPDWIRKRLQNRVTVAQAREALEFLVDRGYLALKADGTFEPTEKNIRCEGRVYDASLHTFHKEMFELMESLSHDVSSSLREIQGYTFAVPAEVIPLVKKILLKSLDEIESLVAQHRVSDSIYHVGIMAMPLALPRLEEET